MYTTIYFTSAQTGQAERDVTTHTSGVSHTAEVQKMTHRAPEVPSSPG